MESNSNANEGSGSGDVTEASGSGDAGRKRGDGLDGSSVGRITKTYVNDVVPVREKEQLMRKFAEVDATGAKSGISFSQTFYNF